MLIPDLDRAVADGDQVLQALPIDDVAACELAKPQRDGAGRCHGGGRQLTRQRLQGRKTSPPVGTAPRGAGSSAHDRSTGPRRAGRLRVAGRARAVLRWPLADAGDCACRNSSSSASYARREGAGGRSRVRRLRTCSSTVTGVEYWSATRNRSRRAAVSTTRPNCKSRVRCAGKPSGTARFTTSTSIPAPANGSTGRFAFPIIDIAWLSITTPLPATLKVPGRSRSTACFSVAT